MKKCTRSLSMKALFGISVILLPVFITFLLIYKQNKAYLKKHILDDITILAGFYESHMYQFLEAAKLHIQDIASDGFIKTQLLRKMHGKGLSVNTLSNYLMKNKLPLYKDIKTIHILSSDGHIVASTNNAEIGRDVSCEAFFIKGKDAVSFEEHTSECDELPDLIISSPIFGKDTGKSIGVIVGFIQISRLNKILSGGSIAEAGAITQKRKSWKTMEVYLVNRDKRVIAEFLFMNDIILKHVVDTLPVNVCLTENKEISGLYKDYRGREVMGASMYIPSMEWILLVEINKDEVLVPIKKMLIGVFITATVVIVLVICLFVGFIKKAVKPLHTISDAARYIANGAPVITIPVQTGDEIGLLCESFNTMAHSIKIRTSALAKSEASLAKAQWIAHLGNWEWDIMKNEAYWSDEAYRIFGLIPQGCNVTFEEFLDYIHPDDREFTKKSIGEALDKKGSCNFGFRIIPHNAAERFVHVMAVVEFDETGKATRMIGTIQDITECKRMEEEIKLLQTIIISISEADDLHSALDIVLCKVCKYTDWDYGEAWLPSSDDRHLKCIQVWHNNSEGLEEFRKKSQKFTFLPGVGLPGRVWSLGIPEWRKDATVDGDFPRAPIAKECGLKASIGIPVIANDKVVAVLNFFVREQHDKDDRLIRLISSVATQLGVIIQCKQIEEALYNSEERLQAILNNATALIYVKDMQGRYTFINKSCEKVLHIKQEELEDKTDYDIWSKEFADVWRMNDRKVFEARTSLEFEEVVPYDDGLYTYISVKFPLYDSHGVMHSICGISTDITGRKRMEKLLYEKEEKYRLLVENIPDVMWTADQTGNTLFITPNVEKVFGYTPEEICRAGNCLWFERIHSEDVERVRGEYSLLFKLNKMFEVKYRIRRKDESWIWIHDRAMITYTKDGNRYANGLFSDITEHKQMEEQLQKLSCAIEQSPNVIIITDTSGNIRYVNPKFIELTGYSMEEVIGKNPCILKSGKTPREAYKRLWDTISSGGKWRGEFLNKKKNGEFYWAVANISPVKNKEGITTHFIEIAEDITNIKRAEESESKLKEQLYHVQKLESIGTLAGGIAHDFNNILAIIMGYGNLLQNEIGKDNALMTYIQKILASTERATNLTKGLLTFSRKQKNNPKPVNLNETIKGVESLLVRLIGEDIQLQTTFIDKDCIVMADSNQIEQVLMNLVTNARDAMPNGGSLTIITEVVELDNEFIKIHGYGMVGKYVLVSISDTGVGIDKETKKRVFEPFFTTKGVGKGTGLGLSIVYGIVKQHQGYINVDSEPGKGSIFKMYIPVIESEVEEIKSEILITRGGKETILLAEDEKEVRVLIKIVLQKAGYKIIEAVDGDDLIRKFIDNKNKIHCLIVDVIMPIKDGKAAYDTIKHIRPDIKAVFISGYSEEIINKKDILKEGLYFISKPILPNELLRKVREVLDE